MGHFGSRETHYIFHVDCHVKQSFDIKLEAISKKIKLILLIHAKVISITYYKLKKQIKSITHSIKLNVIHETRACLMFDVTPRTRVLSDVNQRDASRISYYLIGYKKGIPYDDTHFSSAFVRHCIWHKKPRENLCYRLENQYFKMGVDDVSFGTRRLFLFF